MDLAARHTARSGSNHLAVEQDSVAFVDLAGDQGLLGQPPGRTGEDVVSWLRERSDEFRAAVQYMAVCLRLTAHQVWVPQGIAGALGRASEEARRAGVDA